MQTYYFKGVVTGEEPLTVSVKSSSTTHRLPRNGGYKSRPFMPATSLRGALRHAGHVALNRLVQSKGDRLDLTQHFILAQGVDISGKAVELDAGAIDASVQIRKENPFLSLWGRWGLSGHAGIGNLYPITDDCVGDFGGGARTIMFERNTQLLSFLEDDELDGLNGILKEQSDSSDEMKPIKAQIQTLAKSLKSLEDSETVAKVKAKIAELEQQIVAIKDAKSGPRESIRRPIDTYEAFVAGCEFNHRMAITCANEVELGLFLASLHEFSRNPYLGGHRSHNCGRISARYEISIYPEDADAHIPVGTVSFDDAGFHLDGEHIVSARSLWKETEMNLSVW